MSEEEPSPRIVVRDRRPFAADGSRRLDAEPRSEVPPPTPPPTPDPGVASRTEPGAAAPESAGQPREDPRVRQLVSRLFSQAAVLLEQGPEAGGPSGAAAEAQRAEALQGLQAVIGLLEVLEEKTRGRLAPNDARLVSQALYQLRMAYMERAQAPGA